MDNLIVAFYLITPLVLFGIFAYFKTKKKEEKKYRDLNPEQAIEQKEKDSQDNTKVLNLIGLGFGIVLAKAGVGWGIAIGLVVAWFILVGVITFAFSKLKAKREEHVR